MKTILLALLLLVPSSALARSGGGGTHNNTNASYDCSTASKPRTPKWLTGSKYEALNDRMIILTWADSNGAHKVQIRYGKKKKSTADDSREKILKLKNGKMYSFRVRGVSNCGKSGWSRVYRAMP